MRHSNSMNRGIVTMFVSALALVACTGGSTPGPAWTCPAGWVAYEHGGCGPSVMLCGADGGATAGACDRDAAADANVFGRSAEGAITGGWREPGTQGGPPAADWNPLRDVDCPEGWSRADDGTCDPALPAECPIASAALPGGRCTSTSRDLCPITPYADVDSEVGTAPILYVNASSSATGADGSLAHPYPTLAAAVAAAPNGAWILVAAGTYETPIVVTANLHVVGRCAAMVTLSTTAQAIDVFGAGAAIDLRDITISGAQPALAARLGASATLHRVAVLRAVGAGIVASGADSLVVIDDAFVDRTRATVDGRFGQALQVDSGGTLEASGLAIAHSGIFGAAVVNGTLTLRDSIVRDGLPQATASTAGVGIVTGHVAFERVVFTGNTGVGVIARGGEVTMVDSFVGHTAANPDGSAGRGIDMESGAMLTVSRSLFDDNGDIAIGLFEAGTTAMVRDVVIRNTRLRGDGLAASGIDGQTGAVLDIARVRIENNASTGLLAGESDVTLHVTDSVIVDTHPRGDGVGGVGLVVSGGSNATAERVLIHGFGMMGAAVASGATLAFDDSVIDQATFPTTGFTGGLVVLEMGSVSTQRAIIRGAREVGVVADAVGSSVTLTDTLVADVAPLSDDGTQGVCLMAQDGAELTAERVLATHCREVGVVVDGFAHSTLTDVIIDGVEPSPRGFGTGIMAFGGGSLDLARVAVSNVHAAGIATATRVGGLPSPPSISGHDVFVRGVADGTLRLDATQRLPAGEAVSYGLHTANGTTLTLTHAVVETTGYGVFNSDGTMTLENALLRGARQHAGARASPASVMNLTSVTTTGNAIDDIAVISTLPEAAALPAPTAACADALCL